AAVALGAGWLGHETLGFSRAAPLPVVAEVRSQALFEQALEAAAAIKDDRERAGILVQIAKAQARAGDRAAAQATLEMAARLASRLPASERAATLLMVAERLQERVGVGDI